MRAVVVSALLLASAVHAEDRVPDALGLMVMLKVVSYDTAFATHGAGDFVVLVPYAAGQEAKAGAICAVGAALEVKTIKERPLRFTPVPLGELGAKKGAAVLLPFGVTPEVLKATREKAATDKLYVLAFEETPVREGALLGVALANGKPQPLINVAAMRALGADFGPVLRLARTFQ
ncbi:MAG: hypothetical protein Q8L48_22520 [Archangium sp.]|nr:hypothetical protein [Archangium sp.]